MIPAGLMQFLTPGAASMVLTHSRTCCRKLSESSEDIVFALDSTISLFSNFSERPFTQPEYSLLSLSFKASLDSEDERAPNQWNVSKIIPGMKEHGLVSMLNIHGVLLETLVTRLYLLINDRHSMSLDEKEWWTGAFHQKPKRTV